MEGIEFTDRYGGRPPSGITICRGKCEGMGFYPTQDRSKWPEGEEPDSIGYVFVECPDCKGTGRVPLRRGLLRLPRLLLKGARFMVDPIAWGFGPKDQPLWRRGWIIFKIAFLYDLLRLHPLTARWAP